MPSIHIANLSFAFADPVCLFADLSLTLDSGWTGIVGENGCGKTTLLRLVAGELRPDTGHIRIDPAGTSCHLCPQRVDQITPAIAELATSWQPVALRWMSRLELVPEDLDRWPTLSPGQRKRWQLAAALASAPEVLLLDEPTNHVDAHTRTLLVSALERFRGVGLLVSHDRELLDTLPERTVRIHKGQVSLYRGGHAQAKEQWLAEEAGERAAYQRARHEQKVAERRLADERRKRAAAEATLSSRHRMKDRNDSDARGALAKGRAEAGEARVARNVTIARHRAERASTVVASMVMTRERGRSLFLGYQPAPKARVLALELDELRAGPAVLARDIHLAVHRHERVHLRGDNGTGKTTLMEALRGRATVPEDRILHLPQDLDAQAGVAVRDRIAAMLPEQRGRVLELAAALGMDPAVVAKSACPSPGEVRKLLLACGLGLEPWVLLLDEPTNHLDLPSIERLEEALAEYPGALVLISHDQRFASALTQVAWTLADGRVALSS